MIPIAEIITVSFLSTIVRADYFQNITSLDLIITGIFQLIITVLWHLRTYGEDSIKYLLGDMLHVLIFYGIVTGGFLIVTGRIPYLTICSFMCTITLPIVITSIESLKNTIEKSKSV